MARGVPGGMNSLPRPLHHARTAASAAASEMRRSSAAGLNVVSQRPPLPPKIELRSHSYDGLLDDTASMQRRKVTPEAKTSKAPNAIEGSEDRADGRGESREQQPEEQPIKASQIRKMFAEAPGSGGGGSVGSETSIKSKNRRSRSMDDLFDDDHVPGPDYLDNTQSMETLLEPVSPTSTDGPPDTPPPVGSMGGNICLNRRFVPPEELAEPRTTSQEQLCEKETITVDSTLRLQEDDDGGGPSSERKARPSEADEEGLLDEDVQSTHSSVTSSASGEKGSGGPKKAPKPLINRYVKKVKSFMKM